MRAYLSPNLANLAMRNRQVLGRRASMLSEVKGLENWHPILVVPSVRP